MIRKSLLYRSKVEYGGWTANHVLGCTHGCRYPCYAMAMAKRTGRVASYDEWVHPQLVDNALVLLEKELSKFDGAIESVHLCFSTDPFMYDQERSAPVQEVLDLTLALIDAINARGIPVTTLTKGVYPSRFLRQTSRQNTFGISLVSLSEEFRKKWEPGSSPMGKRIESLEALSAEGFRTWVSIEPFPTPNIDPSSNSILPLLDHVQFVQPGGVRQVELQFLGQWIPGRADSL